MPPVWTTAAFCMIDRCTQTVHDHATTVVLHRTSRRAATAASQRPSTTCSPTRPSSWCRSQSDAHFRIGSRTYFALGVSIGLLIQAHLIEGHAQNCSSTQRSCGGLCIGVHTGPGQCYNCKVHLCYRYPMYVTLCYTSAYTTNAAAAIWPPLLQNHSSVASLFGTSILHKVRQEAPWAATCTPLLLEELELH